MGNSKQTGCAALSMAKRLALPEPVLFEVRRILTPEFIDDNAAACDALTDARTARGAWESLAAKLEGNDPDGMRMLALYITAACTTLEKYNSLGIDGDIFNATMSCFTRFFNEVHPQRGVYVFDRAFWVWRQLALVLFRLGTLEFEYKILTDENNLPPGMSAGQAVLSVHIPSDAKLTDEELRASYAHAREFFTGRANELCPDGVAEVFYCSTWLLSPELRGLLAPTSGIRRFMDDYEIYRTDPDNDSFYRWLFGGKREPEELPQRTSLQRAVAAHIKNGGKIGTGSAIMRHTKR